MRRKNLISLFLVMVLITLNFNFAENVSAETVINDVNILSTTDVLVESAKEWARERGATQTFINNADLYWKYAKKSGGVNPALAYVQSAKETGYGKFAGVIDDTYCNPCGMKMTKGGGDYDSTIHMKFNSWDDGVKAHLDHLALYAGAYGYPKKNTLDPRHFLNLFGKSKTVTALSGAWCPSIDYGNDVLKLYKSLVELDSGYRNTVIQNLPCILNIDTVDTGRMMEQNKILVSGWVLSGTSIQSLNLYVDGVLKGTFMPGLQRDDLKEIHPSYDVSSSGFIVEGDIKDINIGQKEVKIVVVLNNGSMAEVATAINVEKKPVKAERKEGYYVALNVGGNKDNSSNVLEKNEVDMKIAQIFKESLEKDGFNVIISMENDNTTSIDSSEKLNKDKDIAEQVLADAFVSVDDMLLSSISPRSEKEYIYTSIQESENFEKSKELAKSISSEILNGLKGNIEETKQYAIKDSRFSETLIGYGYIKKENALKEKIINKRISSSKEGEKEPFIQTFLEQQDNK